MLPVTAIITDFNICCRLGQENLAFQEDVRTLVNLPLIAHRLLGRGYEQPERMPSR